MTATPGQAAFEAYSRAESETGLISIPWGGMADSVHAWWEIAAQAAIAAQEPVLAVVDLHRWYAVITQPDGTSKVIGHTQDGLGYYDSVDEWEAKNS